ncbi:hypothetical protein SAMD00079811_65160 [Scytonema sp. HK-05]|uniref:hypothetical protein n=1 Tax=Scytonema sp. HK-05 TaxID=1137095 RepID=UPI0009370BB9|nr:hypothetical protein [Scytonema sp. HK-05]OKH46533.1 hypothetical protein NIES2130_36570 [Scytonema sp. HK-05]BAY48887.1 hypothetical protein SAMD00079811_65160 [Scytonema sp. HK-05]
MINASILQSLSEHLAAVVGSVTGAALSITAIILVIQVTCYLTKTSDFGVAFYVAVGVFAGWWLGATGGCWLALLWVTHNHQYAQLTAYLLIALNPLGMFWLSSHLYKKGMIANKLGIRWLIGLIVAVLSLLAQLLANMMIAIFK